MDISALTNVSSDMIQKAIDGDTTTTSTEDFQKVLDSAINMVNETNEYQHKAEEEEIRFALGQAENTHDLQIAQYKASTTIQYITAIKNKAIEAYKEIMNMQI
ncbi:MAG: flagellar hook-basal body complex protein FliE [Lachnospiraceae bacterium]|nr:flagellar hook-basal body complex protein FliE [Lachnospiraceae bacterium]